MFDGTPKKPLSERREEYYYFGQYKAPLLYYSLLQNWADPQNEKYSLPLVDGQIAVLDGHQFILQKDWEQISEATLEALKMRNLKFFEDFFSVAQETAEALEKELTATDTAEDLLSLFTHIHRLQYPWYLCLPMAQAIEEWLQTQVSLYTLHSFFKPDQSTLHMQYQEACQSVGTSRERAEGVVKEYPWVGYMHFWGEGNTVENVLEGALHVTEKKKIEMPVEESSVSWTLPYTQKLTYYRQHFAELCALATYQLHIFLQSKGISRESALWYTVEELLQYIQTGVAIPETLIEERKRGYGLFNVVVTGEELRRLMSVLIDPIENKKIFTGVTASKGLAKGRVKVIMAPNDMSKMEEGDILVAHETTPYHRCQECYTSVERWRFGRSRRG